jgi:hypothetical protein
MRSVNLNMVTFMIEQQQMSLSAVPFDVQRWNQTTRYVRQWKPLLKRMQVGERLVLTEMDYRAVTLVRSAMTGYTQAVNPLDRLYFRSKYDKRALILIVNRVR